MRFRFTTLSAFSMALFIAAPSASVFAATDSDKDGISATQDKCTQSPEFIPVDRDGCAKDRFTLLVEFKDNLFKLEQVEGSPEFDVIAFMQQNPDYDVFVTGLAETIEGPAFDQRLSEKRAREVSLYLIEQGIKEPRITPHARMTEPMATQESPLGEQQNRRLKLEFIKISHDK